MKVELHFLQHFDGCMYIVQVPRAKKGGKLLRVKTYIHIFIMQSC